MQALSQRFGTWLGSNENQAARPQFKGIDCSRPPCVMSMHYSSAVDGGMIERAKAWLNTQGKGLGTVMVLPHSMRDTDHAAWFFWIPAERGSTEFHQLEKSMMARVQAQKAQLPTFNFSAEIPTGP